MYFSEQDIENRRKKITQKWNEILASDEAVIVHSGCPIQKPGGLDQAYPFLPHPSYFWLTGRRRELEAVLYSKNTGWVEFHKEHTQQEAIWEREKEDRLVISAGGLATTDLESYLKRQAFATVYKLGQTHSAVFMGGMYQDPIPQGKTFELKTVLDQTRRCKDLAEVKLIKHIAQIARQGFLTIEELLQPGITEKDLQIAYESEIYRNGSHTTPYDTLVGSGANASILHAVPTFKKIKSGELVLVDAGADIYDYCVDITRTLASDNQMSTQQKDLYALVMKMQQEAIALTRKGNYWRDIHIKAAHIVTQGLLDLGILKGSFDNLIEKQVASVFFPHGLGHLVGLKVRDTGHEENLNPKTYFGARLRVDIQLEAGHLITVEPGCYFIENLLESPDVKSKYQDEINWKEVSQWYSVGGVRIEDDILVTDEGNENLTAIVPKKESL